MPAHPAGLQESQHGWVKITDVSKTVEGVKIPPCTKKAGNVVRIGGNKFKPTQCLLLESRRRTGFERALPGDGLLVWRVDTAMEQTNPDRPAMILIEADGRHDLESPKDGDQGDSDDPFPGSGKHTSLGDSGPTSTSFPKKKSGIRLQKIELKADGTIKLDVVIES